MTPHCRLSALALLLAAALLASCASQPARRDAGARVALTWQTLIDGKPAREVEMSAFARPADARAPSHRFEGTLRLRGTVATRTIHADSAYLAPAQIAAARSFPADFAYDFVQDGDTLLPVKRGYLASNHPHWDLLLEPGRVWDEPGDHGDSRAALPFALVQKHMNCTHYGVLGFVFGDDGRISHAAVEIASETCNYLKLDLWGLLDAEYTPHPVAAGDAVIAAWRANRARRLPTRPIAQLATDHPGLDPARLVIGEAGARTLHGMVINGVNYVSACSTRRGDYPYCDVLPFPSYSTAKSAVGALALLAMAQSNPGAQQLRLADYAPSPACETPEWADVTLRNLADMDSGHYDASGYMADEDAVKVQGFFGAASELGKATFACVAYPRRAAPGEVWVYHTSETFLLGDALGRYLRRLPGNADADLFRDVVVGRVYAPLGLSATARVSRRTSDAAAQAFFGYGVQFHRDDIARLADFIGNRHGAFDGTPVLDPALLDLALQRVPGQHGHAVTGYADFRYQLGFWARDVASLLNCRHPTWVPFMSGFGGISVVMFPNGVIYYNVADSGSAAAFDWSAAAVAANTITPLCR